MNLNLRKIEITDLKAVIALMREFAAFEDLTEYCTATEERLARAMFGTDAIVEGLIALDGTSAVGYAMFYQNFSSFRGELGMYLEDIYVTSTYRGSGVGEMMLKEIAAITVSRQFERIDFQVLDWNVKAIGFYKKLGAECSSDESHYKFAGKALAQLAS